MIRAMIAALSWLDARFPPVVTVTKESFAKLEDQQYRIRKDFASLCESRTADCARLDANEKSIAAIKELLSKASQPAATETARRAAFIGSGRMAE